MGTGISALAIGNAWFAEKPGGLDRVYMELARHLPAAGVDQRGLVVGSAAVAAQSGGRVQAFAPAAAALGWRLLAARRALRAALRRQPPDVLVAHFALYAFPSLERLRAQPFVVHFQGPWAAESAVEGSRPLVTRAQALLERAVYRRADRLIVLSRAFADELARRYRIDPARIRVIPSGVDTTVFADLPARRVARAHLGWPQDRPIVLCLRRLVRRMGLEDLIDAALELRRRVPGVLVLIAGRGPLQAELQQRIDALGLAASVRLLGFVADADLPLAYRAADLGVVPTLALEGFGLITLESLAAGTPVLVTPVGGLPEAVQELARDLVLPASGRAALAAGLGAALRGELALPDAAACQDYVARHHAWPDIATRVAAVYAEAIAEHR
ncbi:MAG: glycosyltransferase family 4 protein [Betaproteobacteria bacterium]|nr:glycosyltransferase family 4 protein [Betaproteobacteria bacterium]